MQFQHNIQPTCIGWILCWNCIKTNLNCGLLIRTQCMCVWDVLSESAEAMNVRSLMDTRQTDRRTHTEREREMCASANVDTVTHDRCDHMPPPAAAAAAAVTSVLLRRRVCRRRLPPVNSSVHIQLVQVHQQQCYNRHQCSQTKPELRPARCILSTAINRISICLQQRRVLRINQCEARQSYSTWLRIFLLPPYATDINNALNECRPTVTVTDCFDIQKDE